MCLLYNHLAFEFMELTIIKIPNQQRPSNKQGRCEERIIRFRPKQTNLYYSMPLQLSFGFLNVNMSNKVNFYIVKHRY